MIVCILIIIRFSTPLEDENEKEKEYKVAGILYIYRVMR